MELQVWLIAPGNTRSIRLHNLQEEPKWAAHAHSRRVPFWYSHNPPFMFPYIKLYTKLSLILAFLGA